MGTYMTGYIPTVDQIAAEARATSFTKRSIKKSSKKQVLEMIVRMIDLTTLEGMDTPGKVRTLCRKARQPLIDRSVPPVAAVCVYPSMVAVAKDALRGSSVKIASVATSFPSGQTYLEERLREVEHVVADGADEVDMVINRGAFLSGDYQRAFDEIKATKAACGQAHLKVILETGELGSYDQVAKASHLAMDAGADFIKTSTGKVTPAATMPVSLVMLEAVRSHYLKEGRQVGFKPAGGIRTAKQAWHYLVMVKETVGDLWLSPDWFRFGASTLLNDVLMQWERLETGHYQSSVYYSLD